MVCSTAAVASCGFCPSSIGNFHRAVSEGVHLFLYVCRMIWTWVGIAGIIKEKIKSQAKCALVHTVFASGHTFLT